MRIFFTTVRNWLADDAIPSQVVDVLNEGRPALRIADIQKKKLRDFLLTLREDLLVFVETNYDDPVYGDSYRSLYANKLRTYPRHCVRLSFFEPFCSSIEEFLQYKTEFIQNGGKYLGFLVIRPLYKCIGRNAIDVKAKKDPWDKVAICKATIKSTCIGHKLSVKAFPHASQDAEHMSCAENSIWALLEYFGNKYAIYDPILPFEILNTLRDYKDERTIPTTGLTYNQISILLKKRGFETKIYNVKNPNFKELFTCYIESGLPLITCIEGKEFGHAVVCIGRTTEPEISDSSFEEVDILGNKHHLCLWNRNIHTFVVNDDNFPSYRIIDYNKPAEGYDHADDAIITSFIVPMHEEIYMPAELAIQTTNALVDLLSINDCCVRTFLTTSRSYRRYVVNNDTLSIENKQALLRLDMPKFVWISEYFDAGSASKRMAQGVFILDATCNTRSGLIYNNLIMAINNGNSVIIDEKSGQYVTHNTNFPQQFKRFGGNLK